MYKVIVGDNQELYRAGVVSLLTNSRECHTISQFSDWMRLLTAVATNRESLVIISTSMTFDLEQLVGRARSAASQVLLIAEDFDSLSCYRLSGVAGVVHRSTSASAFLDSVRKIRSGVDFVLAVDGTGRLDVAGSSLAKSFTSGEKNVVALLMEGMKNRVIAESLHLAEHVVRGRFKNIYDKTGFSNRVELALYISRRSAQRGHRQHLELSDQRAPQLQRNLATLSRMPCDQVPSIRDSAARAGRPDRSVSDHYRKTRRTFVVGEISP